MPQLSLPSLLESVNFTSLAKYMPKLMVVSKSSCSSVRDMKDYNKVGFDSRSEAIDAGYDPCKRCHP